MHELVRHVGGVGAGPDSTGSDGAEDDEWVVDLLLLARRGRGKRNTDIVKGVKHDNIPLFQSSVL